MKLRVFSDLHLEFGPSWSYTSCGEDAVLCAGDLGAVSICEASIEEVVASVTVPFFYVLGNHDAFHSSYAAAVAFYRSLEKRHSHFHLLHNQAAALGKYRLLGTPLWTDFALRGQETAGAAMNAASRQITDFQSTQGVEGAQHLTPEDLRRWHQEARSFLAAEIAKSTPTIVLTHWGPTGQATPQRFASSELEPYFTSNCEDLFGPNVVLWAHGHTHDFDDRKIGRTRLVRNPKGCPWEGTNLHTGLLVRLP